MRSALVRIKQLYCSPQSEVNQRNWDSKNTSGAMFESKVINMPPVSARGKLDKIWMNLAFIWQQMLLNKVLFFFLLFLTIVIFLYVWIFYISAILKWFKGPRTPTCYVFFKSGRLTFLYNVQSVKMSTKCVSNKPLFVLYGTNNNTHTRTLPTMKLDLWDSKFVKNYVTSLWWRLMVS